MKMVKVVKTEIGKLLASLRGIWAETNPNHEVRRALYLEKVKLITKGRKA